MLITATVLSGQSISYNRLDISTGPSPFKIAIADFNKDGKNDIAYLFSGSPPAAVSILLGNGNGTFPAPKTGTFGAGAATRHLAVP